LIMIFFNVNIKKITFINNVFNKTKIKTKINNFLKGGAHPAHPSNFSIKLIALLGFYNC
jgi:hypothetical protein